MKLLTFITRLLLGLAFVIFGLNGFLHFMPMPKIGGAAGEFTGAMMSTGFFYVVAGLQALGGVLLLINRVPLALTLLGPVVVNIVLYHVFMRRTDQKGLMTAAVFGALTLFLLWRNQESFPALFPKSGPKKPAKK